MSRIRNVIQRCSEPWCPYAGDCFTHTYIHDAITVHQAERDPDTYEVIPESDKEITLHNVALEVSHGQPWFHHACRLASTADGTAGHPDVTAEDHTAAAPGQLLEHPAIIEWTPTCQDCHTLVGHGEPAHHRAGLGRRDGILLVHASHPKAESLKEMAEHHTGASWQECERCAPAAAACLGCKASLERAERQ